MKTGPNDIRHVIWAVGEFFFSFIFLKILNNTFVLYSFYLHFEGARWATTTKTGPNDTFGVICTFFSFPPKKVVTNMPFVLFRTYLRFEGARWVTTMKTGPNDARRVVWAISTFSFSFVF